jgi:hypothetical protein
MLDILKRYDYSPPKLKEWSCEDIKLTFNSHNNCYELIVDNQVWMAYDLNYHFQAAELLSHYYLAKGNCVCTGMGLGIRENWIIAKKEVTQLIVVEKQEEIFELHKYLQSPFLKKSEVMIGNALMLSGKCDTLLLDHYENESFEEIINDVKRISDNVECESLWFWPLEKIILNEKLNRQMTCYQAYQEIKLKNKLHKLPDLSEETLNLFCFLFTYRNFLNV